MFSVCFFPEKFIAVIAEPVRGLRTIAQSHFLDRHRRLGVVEHFWRGSIQLRVVVKRSNQIPRLGAHAQTAVVTSRKLAFSSSKYTRKRFASTSDGDMEPEELLPFHSESEELFSGSENQPSIDLNVGVLPTTSPRPELKSLIFPASPQKQSATVDLANQLPRWLTRSTPNREVEDSGVDLGSPSSALGYPEKRFPC